MPPSPSFPRPLLAVFLSWLVLAVALLVLPACSNRVVAKPGIGVGVEQTATGSNVGLNFGTLDVGGAVAHPATGSAPTCSGPDCAVPGLPQTPPLKLQVSGLGEAGTPVGVWVLIAVCGLLVIGLGVLVFQNRPRAVVAGLSSGAPGAAS